MHSSDGSREDPLALIQDTRRAARLPRITLNPNPAGWTERQAAVHTAPRPKREDDRQGPAAPDLRPPRKEQGRLGRLLRNAMALLTMLRRKPVAGTLPVHLQMESTDACNLHCTSCSRDMIVDRAQLLDEALWKKIIDETRPMNVNVSGIGEPFLHPRVFEIIQYARANGAAVNCATNFTRVKGKHRAIVESGIDQLKVSIDACRAETYRAIRGEDAFDEIIEGIREVGRWKEKLGSATPSIRFNFALQRLNFQEAADLVNLASDVGVDGIYFQYLSYNDMDDRKAMLTASMTREALQAELDRARQNSARTGVVTNLAIWERDFELIWDAMQPMAEYTPNDKPCYFPWMSTWIGADGWIRPCPIMPWTVDEGRMGNLAEQSFAEIWNNEYYQELREALARGERPTRSCKTCYPQDLFNIFLLKSKLLPKG